MKRRSDDAASERAYSPFVIQTLTDAVTSASNLIVTVWTPSALIGG